MQTKLGKLRLLAILGILLIYSTFNLPSVQASQLLEPTFESRWNQEGIVYDIAVHENYAMVANGQEGITLLNIADPYSPNVISQFDNWSFVWRVVIDYPLAFIGDRDSGLEILNITDLENPTLLSSLYVGGQPRSFVHNSDLLYIVTQYNDMIIYNISTPNSPQLVSNFSDGALSGAWSIVLDGSYAYIADGWGGLKVIDISNPSYPVKIGEWDDGGDARDIRILGNTVFIADEDDGLEILDVSDPSNPAKLGGYSRYYSTSLHVFENLAIIASESDPFIFLNIDDYSNPKRITSIKAEMGTNIYMQNNITFLCDGTEGLIFADSGYDFDGDDLSDYKEQYMYYTRADDVDSDGDGMWDGWEILYDLNPTDPSDASGDIDGDTLTNLQEFTMGLNPIRNDTDFDGFGDEVDPVPGSFLIPTGYIIIGCVLLLLFFVLLRRVRKLKNPGIKAPRASNKQPKPNLKKINQALSLQQQPAAASIISLSKPDPIPFPPWKTTDTPKTDTFITSTESEHKKTTEQGLLDKFQKIMTNTWDVEIGFLTHNLQLESDQETRIYLEKWKKFLPIEIVQNSVIVHDTEEFHRIVDDYFKRLNADTSINFFEKP